MEHNNILVKLKNSALLCKVTCNVKRSILKQMDLNRSNQLFVRVTKNNSAKRIPNIEKHSEQSPL